MKTQGWIITALCVVGLGSMACEDQTNKQGPADPLSTERLAPPPLEGHVADVAEVMESEQVEQLEDWLQTYQAENGNRYLVYTEDQLPGTLEAMVKRLGRRTQIGQPGLNNGAVIVLAQQERQIYIEVNHGFEWQVPKTTLDRVLNRMVQLHLKQNRYYEAFTFAFDTLHQMTSQVPWEVAYTSLAAAQAAGTEARGQIVEFTATLQSRHGELEAGVQFSPAYYLLLQGQSGPTARVFHSYNMANVVDLIAQPGRESRVFARVRQVSPSLELELLGAQ